MEDFDNKSRYGPQRVKRHACKPGHVKNKTQSS